ncbi:hypothetical protein FACS189418_7300 [Clostridia bacterium]|nr:hypothetical protein FACS189418_7300 [Clostridia bacterium]
MSIVVNYFNQIKLSLKKMNIENGLLAFFCTWFILVFFNRSFAYATKQNFLKEQTFFLFALVFLILWMILKKLVSYQKDWFKVFLFVEVFVYSLFSIFLYTENAESISRKIFALSLIIPLLIVFFYSANSLVKVYTRLIISEKSLVIITAICFIFMVIVISLATVFRYKGFHNSTFDMGIFAQMFHSMKKIGLPFTTVERGRWLSHFSVHFSPIFYLILPFYWLLPTPVTLQIFQAFILALGLIPLLLLCKHFEFSTKKTTLLLLCYVCYPVLSTGTFYDIHENCFYTVGILFLIYAIEAKKNKLFWLSLIFTLMVKEEAPVYLICIALYYLLSGREKKKSWTILIIAASYFLIVCSILLFVGPGLQDNSRLGNFRFEEGTNIMLQTIKAILMNPAYFWQECFSLQNIEYLAYLFLPFTGIIILQKKYSRLVLFLPLLLLNLAPAWPYQSQINFQYHFANAGIFFYLFLLQLKEWTRPRAKVFLMTSVLISILLFSGSVLPYSYSMAKGYIKNHKTYQEMEDALKEIPEDVSVTSSGFLLPHLWNHLELYEIQKTAENNHHTDFLVIDIRYPDTRENGEKMLEQFGNYELFSEVKDKIQIYHIPDRN